MVFCDNSGGSCLNDNDNPHEDGTTFCKQIYKTKKLLAIDEKGKVLKTNTYNIYLYNNKLPILLSLGMCKSLKN